ncbi:trypsin-like peptidase domain-containing protein [Mariniblastus fucicola]|nr:trypsin-like peptidase domain-containing protein [Mariniblastus fucicola]
MGLLDIFEQILQPQKQPSRNSGGGRSAGQSRGVRLPDLDPTPRVGDGGIGDVMHSVVQVVALREGFMGGMSSAWTGSGTIVHPQGVILTNCHVANPRAMGMSSPPADRLGIAITEESDRAPALSYFGECVCYDADLDLAVIRIVCDVKGRKVRKLNLPSVAIGDSDELDLGDRISIFGYPGIGGENVTFTSGSVSGFSKEKGVRHPRAWIKTDATIAGGNSGGTAVCPKGFLVGVPTQAAAGTGITPVDARPVLDTNRDGKIDQRDTPMAIGGFINGLRPVNLAIPLLEKAGMRIGDDRGPSSDMPEHKPAPIRGFDFDLVREKPEFSNLLFSTRVTDDGRPIYPTSSIPAGVDEVYASFDFDNLRNGIAWSVVWMNEGKVIIEQKDTWDDGEEGRKTVKIANQRGVPNGKYTLVVGIKEEIALEGEMHVGPLVDESDSEISGRVVDGESGRGIDGALVIVLKPRVEMRQFLSSRRESDVQSSTETDREGSFQLPEQLPKGNAYSMVIAARGFKPLTVEHALRVSAGAPEHANIGDIELERD